MGKQRTLEFYPSLVRAVGPVPAIVLSKIFYWCDGRLRVKRKGMLWLAKSRKQMCEETGFSLGQQKRAIATLKERGLIIIEQGLFQNKITPFIRLTKAGLALFEATKSSHSTGTEPSQPTGTEPSQPIGTEPSQSSTVVHGTGTTAPTALGDYVANGEDQIQGSQGKKNVKIKDHPPSPHSTHPPSNMDSKQTLAMLAEKKQALDASKVQVKNAAGLASQWQKLVPYHHDLPVLPGGLKIKPLTGKEIGQLAMFLKAVGGAQAAYAIMLWAIKEWHTFGLIVKQTKGVKGVGMPPTLPRVSYLLQHWDTAVGCYKNSQQPPAPNSQSVFVSEAEQEAKFLDGKK